MSTQPVATVVAVVVQTHWDREWYLDHQTTVARLLAVMTQVVELLDAGKLAQFLFDGQTAAYEDLNKYAEPALIARVDALVRAKRIVLGPWYVMADEFLVSGESLLRNLEIGLKDARRAGNCQMVGYLPDTFGHVGQMPQLLRQFGIDSAVLWRGLDSAYAEWQWQAPNGETVGGVFLTEGYYQHPLNVADWRPALEKYLETIAPRAKASELLLTQGGDHLMPIADFVERIEAFNAVQSKWKLQQSTLESHVARVLSQTEGQRELVSGQLRNNARAFVLPDVLSTRRYLKRLNQDAEDRMAINEGLWAALHTTSSLPAKYCEDTWRLMLQNQAHDSICGCSIDAVHDEMVTRYREIDARLIALKEMARAAAGLGNLSRHATYGVVSASGRADVFADDTHSTLWNPLPQARSAPQVVSLFLQGAAADALGIADGTPCEVLSVTPHFELCSPLDDFPDKLIGHRYDVLIDRPLGGLEAVPLSITRITDAEVGTEKRTTTNAFERGIENAFMSVQLTEAGTIEIVDKPRGETIANAIGIRTELDAGDSYNFSPPLNQHVMLAPLPSGSRTEATHGARWQWQSTRVGESFVEMVLSIEMSVPASLSADRQSRSENSVVNRGTLRLRLFTHVDALDCELVWHNTARDQRTRLILPLASDVTETFADSAFEWVRYPVVLANYPTEVTRREMSPAVNPSLSTIVAGRWCVSHRAMQEYEVISTKAGLQLGITLIRSVGWMSRRDLVTRGVGAGPDLPTPGAQCIGTETFSFQLRRRQTNDLTHPLAHSAALRRPPQLVRGRSPSWREAFDIGNANLQVSSFRRVDDEIELRVWNPTDAVQSIVLDAAWQRVRADGARDAESIRAAAPNSIPSHEIATFRRARH
jgi:mannosylglycerate hydrolase